MKALVFNGPRDVRYENYPDPELATDNSVIVKVGGAVSVALATCTTVTM